MFTPNTALCSKEIGTHSTTGVQAGLMLAIAITIAGGECHEVP